MTQGPIIQGWCPGALRPMMSGDGLVVRIRPPMGRLTQTQARGIATLARAHGNGLIDLSNRANLQLRGVSDSSHAPLIDGLRELDLIDPTPEAEARRNIILTPFWTDQDPTQALVAGLTNALNSAPILPSKFGFAIDTAAAPVLRDAAADIWIETGSDGLLLATCKGAKSVTLDTVIPEAMALLKWFLAQGGVSENRGRMASLLAKKPLPQGFTAARQPVQNVNIGPTPQGQLIGFDFGQMQAETLGALADFGSLRLTPWRMILIENLTHPPQIAGVITDPNDPMLRVIACTGAPACTQAHQPTRDLARALAPQLKTLLHVSGCAKGCAHPAAALTLTATPVGFDLICDGPASGIPARVGVSAKDLLRHPELLTKAP